MIQLVWDTLQKCVFIVILNDDVTMYHDLIGKNHCIGDKLPLMANVTHEDVHNSEGCRQRGLAEVFLLWGNSFSG